MKKTDVKKTERSKEFLAEEWLEIVLKGQDKGEGRFCRHGVCSFMGRQPLTFQPVKRKPELEKRFIESRIMESRTMKNRFRGTRNSWFGQEELDSKRNGYGERLRDKTELTEEAEAIEETEMEGQLVQKYQTARWEEAVRHVLLFLPEVLVYNQLPPALYNYLQGIEQQTSVYRMSRDAHYYKLTMENTVITYDIATGKVSYPDGKTVDS